jgi:hypothetical protein
MDSSRLPPVLAGRVTEIRTYRNPPSRSTGSVEYSSPISGIRFERCSSVATEANMDEGESPGACCSCFGRLFSSRAKGTGQPPETVALQDRTETVARADSEFEAYVSTVVNPLDLALNLNLASSFAAIVSAADLSLERAMESLERAVPKERLNRDFDEMTGIQWSADALTRTALVKSRVSHIMDERGFEQEWTSMVGRIISAFMKDVIPFIESDAEKVVKLGSHLLIATGGPSEAVEINHNWTYVPFLGIHLFPCQLHSRYDRPYKGPRASLWNCRIPCSPFLRQWNTTT